MTALIGFDTNILVYAELEPDSPKGEIASGLVKRMAPRTVIAAQALLEFVAVVKRRAPEDLPRALRLMDLWRTTMFVVPTTEAVIVEASELIRSRHFQVWDAVIWAASRVGGAGYLLSEDMHDGLEIGGLTVVNPFRRDLADLIAIVGE